MQGKEIFCCLFHFSVPGVFPPWHNSFKKIMPLQILKCRLPSPDVNDKPYNPPSPLEEFLLPKAYAGHLM